MKSKQMIDKFVANSEKSHQWPQFLIVLCATLMAIASGVQSAWTSPAVPKLLDGELEFEVTEEQASYMVMITPLGYIIGSPLVSLVLDRIGRKYTLLAITIPHIVQWLLVATATNVPVLYLARLITGIGDGALFCSLPVYIGEISEPKIRGIAGASHSVGIIVGGFFINSYASFLPIRTSAYVSLTLPLLFIVTFIWMPESPYYLLMKGRNEEAKKSLKTLRRMRNVDEELSEISSAVQRQLSERGRWRDIFTIRANLRAFLVLVGLRSFQQLSGIVALGYYTQIIFEEAGGSFTPAQSAIICTGVQAVFMFLGSLLVDRFGRKLLFITSCIGSSILLIIMGLYFTLQHYDYMSSVMWLPVCTMILYYVIGATGALMVPNLMAGELLSVSIKPKALALLNIYLGICISIVSKIFQTLDYNFGMHVPFYFFGICCIIGAIFCYFVVPETKGKTLEEIQQCL